MVMDYIKSSVERDSRDEKGFSSGGMLEGVEQELGGGGNCVGLVPFAYQTSVVMEDDDDKKSNNTSNSGEGGK